MAVSVSSRKDVKETTTRPVTQFVISRSSTQSKAHRFTTGASTSGGQPIRLVTIRILIGVLLESPEHLPISTEIATHLFRDGEIITRVARL
jgi:hypothetical protein